MYVLVVVLQVRVPDGDQGNHHPHANSLAHYPLAYQDTLKGCNKKLSLTRSIYFVKLFLWFNMVFNLEKIPLAL